MIEAAPRLDALIAEKVFGCVVSDDGKYLPRCICLGDVVERGKVPPHGRGGEFFSQTIKEYSTDISAAWEVVDKIKNDYSLDLYTDGDDKIIWYCYLENEDKDVWVREKADNAPHAICLAALEALKVMEEEATI